MARRKRLNTTSVDSVVGGQNSETETTRGSEATTPSNTETNVEQSSRPAVESDGQSFGQAPPKKVRGITKKAGIYNLPPGVKIVVPLDEYGIPVGDEGSELTSFLGTLVRNPHNVGIHYTDWRKVPESNKEDMYSIVKEKFQFSPTETSATKKWIFHNMGKKLKTWRSEIKGKNFDPSLTADEILEKLSDNRVNSEQYKQVVTRWLKPEYQEYCEGKKTSRYKNEEPHVTGTKSFARLAYEEAKKNGGVRPTRGQMYHKTRTRKDGTIVSEKVAQVVASLQAVISDPSSSEAPSDWTNDDLSKVKGPEKRGYIRCLGKIPVIKEKGASSFSDPQVPILQATVDTLQNGLSHTQNQLERTQGALNSLFHLIKEHIPNANLDRVIRDMNIEFPDNTLMDRNNSPTNPRSSAGSHYANSQDDPL